MKIDKTISRNELEARIKTALGELIARDKYLFEKRLGERCIAHRFAVHLAMVFPDWDVDCEYNRNGHQFKEIPLTDECRERFRRTDRVVPDIIVHKRGDRGPNLLAIEVKRDDEAGEDCDLAKLLGYMSVIGYAYGLYVFFHTGNVTDHLPKMKLLPEVPPN
jgi:hypothetical protein